MLAEIDDLAASGPRLDELERVRNLRAAAVEASLEQAAERADRLGQYTCLFDAPEMVNSELARYESVDEAGVRLAMQEKAGPSNRVVLTYLPDDVDGEVEPR